MDSARHLRLRSGPIISSSQQIPFIVNRAYLGGEKVAAVDRWLTSML